MRIAGRIGMLTALWLLAWGEISLANALSGVAVAAALLAAFPPSTSDSAHVRVNAIAFIRLAGYVASQLITANVTMTREILRPRPTIRPGVLEHRLAVPSEHVVTVMTSVISLSPGTMTADVDRESHTIYVHFLFLNDVDAARRGLDRLERLASRAITIDAPTKEHE